jgi:hypothetical protein
MSSLTGAIEDYGVVPLLLLVNEGCLGESAELNLPLLVFEAFIVQECPSPSLTFTE